MNTEARPAVTLAPEQVRERLEALAERTFKSAANNAELQLLVRATVKSGSTVFHPEDVWQAVLNHHYYGSDLTFDEIMNNGEVADVYLEYANDVRSIFGNLVALSNNQVIDDSIDPYPGEEDSDDAVVAVLLQGGEQVNYVCSMAGYGISDEAVVKALGEDGYTAVVNHFARHWLNNPTDLGVGLVEHGFGREVATLRSLSVALINAIEAHGTAESDAEKSAQLGTISLFFQLLKGVVIASAKVPNSPACMIDETDDILDLVEKALYGAVTTLQSDDGDRPLFRYPVDEDAIIARNTPSVGLLNSLQVRVAHERRMRRGVWAD